MNAKDNSRTSFDRQAATYDLDRNGSHARTVYGPEARYSGIDISPKMVETAGNLPFGDRINTYRYTPLTGVIMKRNS